MRSWLNALRPNVGVDPVADVIDEVVEQDGTLLEPLHLETPLDHVAPGEQHVPLILRQRRPTLRDEPLQDGKAAGQLILQREMIDGEDGCVLVEIAVVIGGVPG